MSDDDRLRKQRTDVNNVLGEIELLTREQQVEVLAVVLKRLGIEPSELDESTFSVGGG